MLLQVQLHGECPYGGWRQQQQLHDERQQFQHDDKKKNFTASVNKFIDDNKDN